MRIFLVSQEYPPGYVGGIGTQTHAKAHALARLGHAVEVVTAGDEDGSELVTETDGDVTVHAVRTPGGDVPVYKPETYWLGYTWAILRALRLLGEVHAPDVIEFPDYGAEGFAYVIDRSEEDPAAVVVHLHGSLAMFAERIGWPERGSDFHRVGTFMEEHALRGADALIAASETIAELTARAHSLPREQIEVVEAAVDVATFTPAAGARDGAPHVVFVGNVALNKGVMTLVESFARARERHPALRLTIAGEADEDIAAELRGAAVARGAASGLEIAGFVEHSELPELYRSADVVAAPSHFEGGLGMVYLEAMACGVPVIAAAAGGAREAVVDGETGLLVEPGDVAATTGALEALLADSELRRRMGAAGRRRVEERFTPERYAQRLLAAYERAIAHRRRALAEA